MKQLLGVKNSVRVYFPVSCEPEVSILFKYLQIFESIL